MRFRKSVEFLRASLLEFLILRLLVNFAFEVVMASFARKRIGLLTYLGTTFVPIAN